MQVWMLIAWMAGILLILENPDDERHLIRVESIIKHFELTIDVLAIRAGSEISGRICCC